MSVFAASFPSCECQVSNSKQLRDVSAVYAYISHPPPKSGTSCVLQAWGRPRNFRAAPPRMRKKCWHAVFVFTKCGPTWWPFVFFLAPTVTNRPRQHLVDGNTVCIQHLYIRDATVPDHASFHKLGGKSISRSLSRTSSGLGYAAAAMRCMICI